MGAFIAVLLVVSTLAGCTAPMETVELPDEPAPLEGTATFSQAAPESLHYAVELETLEDTAVAEDGVELARYTYVLPVMSVTLEDGTELQEAKNEVEETALSFVEAFNGQFQTWAESNDFHELVEWAAEDRTLQTEAGLEWNAYTLELDCSVYQTDQLVSVRAEYYSYTGGAHPNTVLMAWNFDLTSGQFFTPEVLATDGQRFSEAVQEELVRQSREVAAESEMAPEEFFWSNYEEILAGWSSYAVSFDETGMTVGFSPYELAAYAAGSQVYHLSYSQLLGYLSDHGRQLLGLAETEE